MAKIPFSNEPNVKSQLGAPGRATNAVTMDTVAGEESFLAGLADVAVPIVEKYAIKKQNEIDTRDTQNAYSNWKALEFEFEQKESQKRGQAADGGTLRARQFYEGQGRTPDSPLGVLSEEEAGNFGEPAAQSQAYEAFQKSYEHLPERLRVPLDGMILKRKHDFMIKAMTKETKEREDSVIASSGEATKQSQRMAINNWRNERVVGEEKQDIINAQEALANIYGWSREHTDNIILGKMSTVHEGIITMQLAEGTQEGVRKAREYADLYNNELTISGHAAVVKAIREKDVLTQANVIASQALALPLDQVGAFFEKNSDDPDALAKARSLYKTGSVYAGQLEKGRSDAAYKALSQWLLQSDKATGQPVGNSMNNITDPTLASMVDDLGPKGPQQLHVLEQQLRGEIKVTDEQDGIRQDELYRQLSTEEGKKKFLEEDIYATNAGKLQRTTMEKFRKIQEGLAKGENNAVKIGTRLSGIYDGSKWIGPDYAEHRGKTTTAIVEKLDAFFVKNGRNAEGQEINDIAKEVMTIQHMTDMKKLDPAPDAPDAIGADFTPTQIINNEVAGLPIDMTTDAGKLRASDIKGAAMQMVDNINKSRHAHNQSPKFDGKVKKEVSTAEAGEIVATIIADKVFVDDNFINLEIGGYEFDSPDDSDIRTMAEVERNPTDYPRNQVYVVTEEGNKKVLISQIDNIPLKTQNKIGRFLKSSGHRLTMENVAEAWLAGSDLTVPGLDGKFKTADISRAGVITNPNGPDTTNILVMREAMREKTVEQLTSGRQRDIGKKFGPIAQQKWDQMAMRKLVSQLRPQEIQDRSAGGIPALVGKHYGKANLEYFMKVGLMKMDADRARLNK